MVLLDQALDYAPFCIASKHNLRPSIKFCFSILNGTMKESTTSYHHSRNVACCSASRSKDASDMLVLELS